MSLSPPLVNMSAPQVGSSLAVAEMQYHYCTRVSYPSGGDGVVKVRTGLYYTMLEPKLCFHDWSSVYSSRRMHDGQGVLEECSNLVGLVLGNRIDYCEISFTELLKYTPSTLRILDMPSCHISYEVFLEIGALPHLQVFGSTRPWNPFFCLVSYSSLKDIAVGTRGGSTLSFTCSTVLGLGACAKALGMQALGIPNAYIHRTCSTPWKGFPQLKLLRIDWTRSVSWEALEPVRCASSCCLLCTSRNTQGFRCVFAFPNLLSPASCPGCCNLCPRNLRGS